MDAFLGAKRVLAQLIGIALSDGSQVGPGNPVPVTGVLYQVVIASDGVLLPVDSLAQTLTYGGPGGVQDTTSVVHNEITYKQTKTFTALNVTGISGWIKQ